MTERVLCSHVRVEVLRNPIHHAGGAVVLHNHAAWSRCTAAATGRHSEAHAATQAGTGTVTYCPAAALVPTAAAAAG